MKILFLLLISFGLYAQTYEYEVEFDANMESKFEQPELEDISSLIKQHINYSVGSMSNSLARGDRRVLNPDYVISNVKLESLRGGRTKVSYHLKGILISEKMDLDKTTIALPVDIKKIYSKANNKKSTCTRSGFKLNKSAFYWAWSPYYNNCKLIEGKHYQEIDARLIKKEISAKNILTSRLIRANKFESFVYLGSDFLSMRRFGYAKLAYQKFSNLLFNMGFKKNKKLDEYELEVFGKDRVSSYFKVYSKKESGIDINVYIMLGNPTDSTPVAKKEFFDFIKYGIENGNYIHYAGHAGLGKILDLNRHEQFYSKRIEYPNHYQVFYYDACNTYYHSSKFLMESKNPDQLVDYFSNGISIGTDLAYPVLKSSYLQIYNSVVNQRQIEVKSYLQTIFNKIKKYFRLSKDAPMLNHQRL